MKEKGKWTWFRSGNVNLLKEVVWRYANSILGKYVGEINDGDMHGHGIYTSTDGGKYVGEFKDGNFWNGTTYEIDGIIFGKWVNGKLKVK